MLSHEARRIGRGSAVVGNDDSFIFTGWCPPQMGLDVRTT
jgi:hypothetical protein